MKKYFLLFPIIILALVGLSRTFIIKNIECTTQYGPCSAQIIQPLDGLMGTSLLIPKSTTNVEKQILAQVTIKSVQIYHRLPNSLQVKVDLRSPVGLVGSDITGENSLLIDSEGIVLGTKAEEITPLLVISDFNQDAKSVAQNYTLALKILNQLSQLSTSRVTGILEGSTLTVVLVNGPKLIIDIGDNVDRWYFPLQQVIGRSKITSKSPTKVDLRFKNPVLTY